MRQSALLLVLLPLLRPGTSSPTVSGPSPEGRLTRPPKTCPQACRDAQTIADWSAYHDVESLAVCPEPVLLQFNIYTSFGGDGKHIDVRACTLGDASTRNNLLVDEGYVAPDAKTVSKRALNDTLAGTGNTTCGSNAPRKVPVAVRLSAPAASDANTLDLSSLVDTRSAAKEAIAALEARLREDVTCGKTIMFAYVRGTLLGFYAGKLVDKKNSPVSVLQPMDQQLETTSKSRHVSEVCDGDSSPNTIIGAVIDTAGDFAAVQQIVKGWDEGKCGSNSTGGSLQTSLWLFDRSEPDMEVASSPLSARGRFLQKRAECRSIRVEQGDGCDSLAVRCGIGSLAFRSFNKGVCDKPLMPSQPVCCSSGDLPDRPKPQADGTCAVYEVKADEGCATIAAKHGLQVSDLDDFNKKTWGWDGCGNLLLLQRICISKGEPPMPATFPDATCGPTVPGSKRPSDGTELADINPCPLNVCCNVWGNCGITADFCTISKTTTGNPGTTNKGEHGCQSNCGFKMVNNDKAPDQFRKIAYFEAWNYNRPCLNMHVLDIDKSYTHVHFAFGEISDDLHPVIPPDQQEQFDAFVSAPNFSKKILAFGGWAFSNEGTQTGNFRKAFLPANRALFADRVVKFAEKHQLAGVDFDWEYPAAVDIEGSDPGQKEDGENYYQFLRLIRGKMPKNMSLSIATPASYWYLRGFPIKKMAEVLDYIVYMTYDFHGQWDVGSKWSQAGCEGGNCLRSHINSTITNDALIMITKAGVASHKVVVGVSSYGRSFKMADPTCRGPMCTFLGERNQSPAKKGVCTGTGGYISNFEINQIIKRGGLIKTWYDVDTDTDYLVYDGVEWVAYMSDITKSRRARNIRNLNFGGTSDWAVDLQGEGSGARSGRPLYLGPEVYQSGEAQCQPPCVLVFPPSKLPSPTTIRPGTYTTSLEYGADGRTTISGRETTAFVTRTTTITLTIPAVTISSMPYSNVNITAGQKSTALWAIPSVRLPTLSVAVPNGQGGSTTRVLTLPPWPAVTRGPPRDADEEGGEEEEEEEEEEDPWDIPVPFPVELDPKDWPTTREFVDDPIPIGNEDTTPTAYPDSIVTTIPDDVEDIELDEDGSSFRTPCDFWFFNLCPPNNDGPKIGGLRWTLPPGKYPPGPPPHNILRPPPDIGPIKPPDRPLPPWPAITVGPDRKPTVPPKPASCKTETASLCATRTVFSTTRVGTTTSTATSVTSLCNKILGCAAGDWEIDTTVTEGASCPLPTPAVGARGDVPDGEHTGSWDESPFPAGKLQGRMAECGYDMLVLPRNMDNRMNDVRTILGVLRTRQQKFIEIKSNVGSWTAGILVLSPSSSTVQDMEAFFRRSNGPVMGLRKSKTPTTGPILRRSDEAGGLPDSEGHADHGNWSDSATFFKRQSEDKTKMHRITSKNWSPAQVSLPNKEVWKMPRLHEEENHYDATKPESYTFRASNKHKGEPQYIYVLGEDDIWEDNEEFSKARSEGRLDTQSLNPDLGYMPYGFVRNSNPRHGTHVTAMIIGNTMGVCPTCHVVFVKEQGFRIQALHTLVMIYDHILSNKREGRAVISGSFDYLVQTPDNTLTLRYREVLEKLETDALAGLVFGAGNYQRPRQGPLNPDPKIDGWPALLGMSDRMNIYGTVKTLISVGATNEFGQRARFSNNGDLLTTYAPGEGIDVPGTTANGAPAKSQGTSYAGPIVAGVAAYLRSLDSPWQSQLRDPGNLKRMIRILHRRFQVHGHDSLDRVRPVVWNGQVGDKHCLADFDTADFWDNLDQCPFIPQTLAGWDVNPGQTAQPCNPADKWPPPPQTGASAVFARQDGGSCPIPPRPGSGSGGSSDRHRIEWTQGPDSPRCPSGNCGGQLCSGYYCAPKPSGVPPDFRDPKDPKGPLGPNVGSGGSGGGSGGGGGGGGGGDDEEEEPSVPPSNYNWGIRYYNKDCEEVGSDEVGLRATDCTPVGVLSDEAWGVSGFTKNRLRACFYDNADCAVESNSDAVMFGGGDRIYDLPEGDCGNSIGKELLGMRIVDGEEDCRDRSGYWGITWHTKSDCDDKPLSRVFGTGEQEGLCQTNIPEGAKRATAYGLGLIICLYESTDCDKDGGLVALGGGASNGSPLDPGECVGAFGKDWGSYKVGC